MINSGILLYEGDPNNSRPVYDSRKSKVTVDLAPPSNAAKVLEMNGGTIITGINASFTETLRSIPHKMPFVPLVYNSFYVRDAPGDRFSFSQVGTFQSTHLFLVANAFGYGFEEVFLDVDETYLHVKHAVSSQSAEFRGVGSLAKFSFRYLVTNLRDINANARL